jgi:gamma-butyrobetaine dioxygenase
MSPAAPSALGLEVLSSPAQGGPVIALRRPDGTVLPIHPIWLRERCPLPASRDPLTLQRLFEPPDLDLGLHIVTAALSGGGTLDVAFSDGHRSIFSISAILAEAEALGYIYAPVRPRLWDRRLNPIPHADWSRIGAGDGLRGLVGDFLTYGFILLRNVPTVPGSVLEVAKRLGQVRDTNFGALFDVRSKPEADDLAYTGLALAPHTDNPYREPVPGIQLLHCLINQAPGGDSTLVDGFAAAAELRRHDPAGFAMLARTPVRYRYCDAATELVAWQVPIQLDAQGEVAAIHHSPRLDFVPLRAPEDLSIYYRARQTFTNLLASKEFEIRFRLGAGDLEMFDNRRILHGRTAFDSGRGDRHLQGCYIDRDGPESLYRVLGRSGQPPAG